MNELLMAAAAAFFLHPSFELHPDGPDPSWPVFYLGLINHKLSGMFGIFSLLSG